MDSSTWRARFACAAAAFVAIAAAASTGHAGNPQPPNPINAFQCYEIKPRQFQAIPGVNIINAFGNFIARVRFPHRLCAPAIPGVG